MPQGFDGLFRITATVRGPIAASSRSGVTLNPCSIAAGTSTQRPPASSMSGR